MLGYIKNHSGLELSRDEGKPRRRIAGKDLRATIELIVNVNISSSVRPFVNGTGTCLCRGRRCGDAGHDEDGEQYLDSHSISLSKVDWVAGRIISRYPVTVSRWIRVLTSRLTLNDPKLLKPAILS